MSSARIYYCAVVGPIWIVRALSGAVRFLSRQVLLHLLKLLRDRSHPFVKLRTGSETLKTEMLKAEK
jgi:hypothetical protein